MSNIEKAAEILNRLDRARDGRPSNEFIAHSLSHVGLLAADLPEPYVTSPNGTPVWRADKTHLVNVFHNMVGMWVPDTGEAQYTPDEARAQALALLAAANYAEEANQ